MLRVLALFIAVLSLSACATALEDPVQDVQIDIVGTGEALCDVTQPGRRYRVSAPGTVRIMKSREPMTLRCFAPANRQLTQVVDSKITNSAYANLATGVLPGMLWDAESGALFRYPDKIVMDFSGMPPQEYPLPDYQKVIAENPSIAGMEEFRPGKAALNRDIGQAAPEMIKRPVDEEPADEIVTDDASLSGSSVPQGGSNMDADAMTRSSNPSVFSAVPEEDK